MREQIEEKNGGSLLERLRAYGETNYYPFHMPGHKRAAGLGITSFPNPFSVDITEIDGFDNLHHPEGILKESMERAASVYGADHTFFLVNGSTCGILSAICASVKNNGLLVMARNSHKSAYHAALVQALKPVYVYPDYISGWGIQGGVSPERIRILLKENPGAEAVFITSPTYEGIVSDIEEIARIVHESRAALIVDEAHGAHFPFGNEKSYFPKSALECGADLVIQSLHKTLPCLTQTALLHVKGNRVDMERLRRYLQIFQSSSPSYVLMAAIDNCILNMDKSGREALIRHGKRMEGWMKRAGAMKCLRAMDHDICQRSHVKDRDLSKILVSTMGTGQTGTWLADRLRERYHLEPEMSCGSYALYMTSLMDSGEGLERLLSALLETDRELCGALNKAAPAEENRQLDASIWDKIPVRCMSIAAASDSQTEEILLREAAGRISASFITVYPPGVPALTPGEQIGEEAAEALSYSADLGLTVEGLSGSGTIRVVKNKDSEIN